MRKYIYIGLFFLLCAGRASAQFTLVSGTVTDSTGLAYACATITATIVNNNGQSLYLNGVQFSPAPGATKLGCATDPSTSKTAGAFTLQLADNTQIKCGSGASIITCASQTQWLFLINSPGIPPPAGTGPQTCTATLTITGSSQSVTSSFGSCPVLANALPSSGSPASVIDVTQFGVKADGKACFDGTVTLGSPNISSAGQCQWTSADIGKKVFVTTICGISVCGFGVGMSSITVLPTQLTVARISVVTDATHIVADCASPGTCVSPNATQTFNSAATILYGDDDTTALNNAFASWNGAGGCPTVLFPKGLIFFNGAVFTSLPTVATNQCTMPSVVSGSKTLNLANAVGNNSVTFKGQGPVSTVFVPTSDFNFAGCPLGGCMFTFFGPTFEDFGVDGFGQSLLGAGATAATLVACRPCIMQNVHFGGWASRVASGQGIDFGGGVGFAYASNMYVEQFGGGNGGVTVSGDANQIVNSTFGFAGNSLHINSGTLVTANNIYYGPTQFNAPTIDVSGTWISSNDRSLSAPLTTAPTPVIRVENGSYAQIDNFFYQAQSNANDSGLSVVAGGTAKVYGWKTSISTLTSGGNIAGTLMGWGNDFGGPLTVTGTVSNAPSEQGSVTCAANTATITFHSPITYRSNPVVLLTDNTTAGGARVSAETTTTATVTCTGATDVVVFTVTPNPN